ncbi:Nkrf protein, partial [Aphelenchoides avenae]
MTEEDTSWIEQQRTRSESNDQWALRKSFIEKYVNDYARDYLVCLSQVFVNRIYLKCSYAPDLTDLVERLGKGLTSEHPELIVHPPEPSECVLPTIDDDEDDEDVACGTPPEAHQLPPPMFGPMLQVQEESSEESKSESASSGDGSTGDELGGTTRSECVTASGNEATAATELAGSSLPQAPVMNAPDTHDATSG